MSVPTYVDNSAGSTAKHVLFENEVLESKLDSLLITALDMNQFLSADYSLAEKPGMKKVINTYTAEGSGEYLKMGEGNTEEIAVSFTPNEYVVKVWQQKLPYYDEQFLNDPMVVDRGMKAISENFANKLTEEAVTEFKKATLIQYDCTWAYEDVVDAIAQYPYESEDDLFLLIAPEVQASFRKNLKDSLQYVEANVRTGYIGSVCGVPVYVTKALSPAEGEDNVAILADRRAVTAFMKKGVEVEQERDADTRKNTVFARNIGLIALTDATRVVLLTEASE